VLIVPGFTECHSNNPIFSCAAILTHPPGRPHPARSTATTANTRLNRDNHRPLSGHAEHHQCHIIVLRSAPCERLCCGEDSPHAFHSWKSVTRFGDFNQSLLAPFFIANIHRFGNSVRKEHNQVSGFMRKNASLIPLWEKPDHRTACFQAQQLVPTAAITQDYGGL
jgi:hypothetical protein